MKILLKEHFHKETLVVLGITILLKEYWGWKQVTHTISFNYVKKVLNNSKRHRTMPQITYKPA